MSNTPTTREESGEALLRSLWNDTGLRDLMRPDQRRRIARFLGEDGEHCKECVTLPGSGMKFRCRKCEDLR